MDIKKLKHLIETNTLDDSILILKYSDNKFLSLQYVDEISKQRNKKKLFIESLQDIPNQDADLFDSTDDNLYIIDVEKFTEHPNDSYKNLIIVSKDIPSDLSIDYVDMTKILNWQIEDYIKLRLKGLEEGAIKWLCEVCKYDIFRLNQECKKLELFSKAEQKSIFMKMNEENSYSDLNSFTIYNYTNAILKKDKSSINNILKELHSVDIEGTGLVTILLKNIRNIIDIQFNPAATASSLNMTPKQFIAVKYQVNTFSNSQLINIYEFLLSIDSKLKNGDLQFSIKDRVNNNRLVEYVTLNVLYLGGVQ